MTHRTELALRTAIENTIERAVPPTVWEYFRTIGRVNDVLQGDYLEEDLIADIEPMLQYEDYVASMRRGGRDGAQDEASCEVVRREASAYPELDALCEIMVIEASRNPEIVGFRNDILGGNLMPRTAVEQWVRDEAEKAGDIPLSSMTAEDQAAMMDQVMRWRRGKRLVFRTLPDWPERPQRSPEEQLTFPVPGRTSESPLDYRERSVPMPARGPLWLLRFVAVGLMEEYPWSEAQAVGFILSDTPPRLPSASLTRYDLFPFRIVLDLDPGLDADLVSSEYRKAQRELIRVRKRAKPQSEKHLRLAVFQARGRTGTWRENMEAWNAESRPEWTYRRPRQFERDAKQALAVLMQRRDRSRMSSALKRTEHIYGLR